MLSSYPALIKNSKNNRIAKEKQFNKQVEMNMQLKELQQQLNGI